MSNMSMMVIVVLFCLCLFVGAIIGSIATAYAYDRCAEKMANLVRRRHEPL